MNATFITHIPKKMQQLKSRIFASLVWLWGGGGVYKFIAKVLTTRLHTVMENIISASHNAFVRNKQIVDHVLITNECLDSRLKTGLPCLLCKLDVEKAFDHVNWGFLM